MLTNERAPLKNLEFHYLTPLIGVRMLSSDLSSIKTAWLFLLYATTMPRLIQFLTVRTVTPYIEATSPIGRQGPKGCSFSLSCGGWTFHQPLLSSLFCSSLSGGISFSFETNTAPFSYLVVNVSLQKTRFNAPLFAQSGKLCIIENGVNLLQLEQILS